MKVEFSQKEIDDGLQELLDLFQAIGIEEAIFMNHYQLAEQTGQPAEEWKSFLMHPKVSAWIDEELYLFKNYQFKQIIRDATDASRSVGAAQMMNAMGKALSESKVKEGPIIIYTYVPPLPDQEEGSEVETLRLDDHIDMMIPGGGNRADT